MPRGIFATTPGRMNGREARELAREIKAARPEMDVTSWSVAQGICVVELHYGIERSAKKALIRNRQDWERWQQRNPQ